MKSLFICIAILAIAALVCAKKDDKKNAKGGHPCNDKVLEFICSPKGNEMAQGMIAKMNDADCKQKANALLMEITPQYLAACAGRAGKTEETCATFKKLMKESKDKIGEDCLKKGKEGK